MHHYQTMTFVFLYLLSSFTPCLAVRPERPNVLFIMSDDHTTQAIGAYGGRLAAVNPTPNIDALAKGGMRFDRVFCWEPVRAFLAAESDRVLADRKLGGSAPIAVIGLPTKV